MNPKLSAAEIKTLQAPETVQVKTILPLIFKELVLNGWLAAQKGKRPINNLLWVVLAVLAIGFLSINIVFGVFACVVLLITFFASLFQTLGNRKRLDSPIRTSGGRGI